MKTGDEVLYENKKYQIIWIYENGNLEIKKSSLNCKLVHKSEIKFIQKTKSKSY